MKKSLADLTLRQIQDICKKNGSCKSCVLHDENKCVPYFELDNYPFNWPLPYFMDLEVDDEPKT